MKKLVIMFIAFISLFSMVSCGNSNEGGSGGNSNTDLEIVDSIVDQEGHYRIVVKNNSDQPIKDYTLALLTFDKSGFPVSESYPTYEKVTNLSTSYVADSANILPGHSYGINRSWYGDTNVAYIKSAIYKITYMDGTTWEDSKIENWGKDNMASFDVEAFKNDPQRLENAKSAQTNDYVSIEKVDKEHTNQFSTNSDLLFTLKNNSDKLVKKIVIAVAEYDKNNFPISVDPYEFIAKNVRLVEWADINLQPAEVKDGESSLFLEGECDKLKAIITEVVFEDEEVWQNPNIIDWILYNENQYTE